MMQNFFNDIQEAFKYAVDNKYRYIYQNFDGIYFCSNQVSMINRLLVTLY